MNARPTDRLAIAVAQLNPIVGDIAGNADKARRARAEAARDGADIVAFPELFLSGYPPEDLVLKPAFQAACRSKIEELARETADGGPALLIGTLLSVTRATAMLSRTSSLSREYGEPLGTIISSAPVSARHSTTFS